MCHLKKHLIFFWISISELQASLNLQTKVQSQVFTEKTPFMSLMTEKASYEKEPLQQDKRSCERISEDSYHEDEAYLNNNRQNIKKSNQQPIQRGLMGSVEEDIFHRHVNQNNQIPILSNVMSSDNQSDHKEGQIAEENVSEKPKVEPIGHKMENISKMGENDRITEAIGVLEKRFSTNTHDLEEDQILQLESPPSIIRSMAIVQNQEAKEQSTEEDASADLTDQVSVTGDGQPISRVKSVVTIPETTSQIGASADLKQSKLNLPHTKTKDKRLDISPKGKLSPIYREDSQVHIQSRTIDDKTHFKKTEAERLRKQILKEMKQTTPQEHAPFLDSPSSICDDAKIMKPGDAFQPYLLAEENKTYQKIISHPQISDEKRDIVSPAFSPKHVDDESIENTVVKIEEINLECRAKGETEEALTNLTHVTPLKKSDSLKEQLVSPNKEISFTKVHKPEEDVYERSYTAKGSIMEINFTEAKSQPETDTFNSNVVSKALSIPEDIHLNKPTQKHSMQPFNADSMTPKLPKVVKVQDYDFYLESMLLKEAPSPLMSQHFFKDHGSLKKESVSPTKDIDCVHKSYNLRNNVQKEPENPTAETSFKNDHFKEAKSQPELDTLDGIIVSDELNIPKGGCQMTPTQDHSVQPVKQGVEEIKKSLSAGRVKEKGGSSKEGIHSEGGSETYKVPKTKDNDSLKEAALPLIIAALSNDDEPYTLRVSEQKTELLPQDEKVIIKPEHVSCISENMEMTRKPFKAIRQMERDHSYLSNRHIQEEKSPQSEYSEDATFLKTEQFSYTEKPTQDYEEHFLEHSFVLKEKPVSKMDLVQQHEFAPPEAANLRGIRDMVLRVCFIKNLITSLAHI